MELDLSRRGFLGLLTVPLIPSILNLPKAQSAVPEVNRKLVCRWQHDEPPEGWPLKIEKELDPPDWSHGIYHISKGPYYTRLRDFGDGLDLRDCHGLCATVEMTMIVRCEIEYDHQWIRDHYFDLTESQREWMGRRCHLSWSELRQIYELCCSLRGGHSCVYKPTGRFTQDQVGLAHLWRMEQRHERISATFAELLYSTRKGPGSV